MKAKITLEFDDLASAAVALLALRGPLPTFTVVPHPPTVVSTPEQAAPAPAPQETVSDREVVATPAAAAPAPRRTRKDAKTGAASAPTEPERASVPAEVAPGASTSASTAEPVSAAPVAASTEFKPPLGPTFTLDKTPSTPAAAPAAPAGGKTDAEAAPVVTPAASATPAGGTSVPAIGKVQEAVEAVLAAKGTPAALASLSRFGVKRGRELLESQRAEFIAYCGEVVAGKVDPVAGIGVA